MCVDRLTVKRERERLVIGWGTLHVSKVDRTWSRGTTGKRVRLVVMVFGQRRQIGVEDVVVHVRRRGGRWQRFLKLAEFLDRLVQRPQLWQQRKVQFSQTVHFLPKDGQLCIQGGHLPRRDRWRRRFLQFCRVGVALTSRHTVAIITGRADPQLMAATAGRRSVEHDVGRRRRRRRRSCGRRHC